MTETSPFPPEPTLFEARLRPHRSLSPAGFIAVMAVLAGASFTAGTAFLLMGAWPVFGFFGLDVLLVWIAFRANFRAARAYEDIHVTPNLLLVQQVSARGEARRSEFNPRWVRLETARDEDYGMTRLALISRGVPLVIGAFLPPRRRDRVVPEAAFCLAWAMSMQQTITPAPLRSARNDASPNDYETVRRAIVFVSEQYREQPSVEAIAHAAGTNPRALTELFRRWCGLTPIDFLAAVTLNHARRILRDGPSILDTSFELGLSGPGRLHDLFVAHEAMSPGEWKSGGGGLTIGYGFHASPFGGALVMATERGLCGLAFADPGEERAALDDMRRRWPNARYVEDQARTASYAQRIFDSSQWRPETPLRVVLIGTDFEVRVWETLLAIPLGRATTYSDIASKIGRPNAARAIGAAVGKNPVSFVVPCHRVLGKNGDLTGYHWGLTRKRAMLGWEAARLRAA